MPFDFKMEAAARQRLAATGFNPTTLPHETIRACDLCEWTVFRTIAHVDRYGFEGRYQMCEGCGLVFQNPHPTGEGYGRFYANWYRTIVAALQGRQEDPARLRADQAVYAAKVVNFIEQNKNSITVRQSVDLGGSMGLVAKAVQDALGGSCLVVDPSSEELGEASRLGLQCEQALAEEWNPKGRLFDLVLICRSVDHFMSISRVLSKIAGCLNPNGLLFVDPVDFESWARTMLDYRKMLKIDHVFYLSDETMRLYLRRAGFDVVASDFGNGTHISYLARYTGETHKPTHLTAYAYDMGRILRERLVKPIPPPYPVDPLTRLIRRVRG